MKKFPKEMYITRRIDSEDESETMFYAYDDLEFDDNYDGDEISVYQLVLVGKLNVKTTVTIDSPKKDKAKR